MNRKQRIEIILKNNFVNLNIIIQDISNEHAGHNNFDGSQGTHFRLKLIPTNKTKLNRLATHQKINNLLKSEFSNGLHALEIKILN